MATTTRPPAIGAPNPDGPARIGYWSAARLARRKRVVLPGTVMPTDLGSAISVTGAAVVENAAGQQLLLQFRQTGQRSHEGPSATIAEHAHAGRIARCAVVVDAKQPFGRLLPTLRPTKTAGPRRVGRAQLSVVLQLSGRRRSLTTPSIAVNAYAQLLPEPVRARKVAARDVLMLPTFWPEEWCFNPICHPHWTWWPGVPATTSCHGFCIWLSCHCPIAGVMPPATGKLCTGITLCWCQ
ncbi:MAG: hypothetical protein QNJ91_03660 [Gammaproteobacteria bacterium]|nr:hypothetical protein [Gammaproteobacteria bacterium]